VSVGANTRYSIPPPRSFLRPSNARRVLCMHFSNSSDVCDGYRLEQGVLKLDGGLVFNAVTQ